MVIRFPVLVTTAIVAALLAPRSSAQSQTMISDCHDRPNPECLLELAHLEVQRMELPIERLITLARIAVAESLAGYSEEAEDSFARAMEIYNGPDLAQGLELNDKQSGRDVIIFVVQHSGLRILTDPVMPWSEQRMHSMIREFLVAAQIEADKPVESVELFIRHLEGQEYDPDLYIAAADTYVLAERMDEARYFLQAAIKQAEIDGGGTILAPTLADIIDVKIKLGDLDEAITTLRDPGVQLNVRTRISKLTDIAQQQERNGNRDSALATLAISITILRDPDAKIDAFSRIRKLIDIADQQERTGSRERALDTLAIAIEIIRNPNSKLDAMARVRELASIALQQEREGSHESALATMLLAEEFFDTVEEIEDREFTRLVLDQLRADITGVARSSVDGEKKFPGDRSRLFSIQSDAMLEAEHGNFENAVGLALELEDHQFRNYTLSRIAEIQTRKGNIQAAQEAAALIASDFSSSAAFWAIAKAQAKAGNTEGFLAATDRISDENFRIYALNEGILPLAEAGALDGAALISRQLPHPAQRAKAYVTIVIVMAKGAATRNQH